MARADGGCTDKMALRSALGAGGVSPPMAHEQVGGAYGAAELRVGISVTLRMVGSIPR